ncbi:hypothetical protein L1285_14220 [Pseudoalteromonas sp. DL2-H2.2]|uniref:hypothetical protein n=1 Tax=Pseudoalteromonas sp. DL2-H2.2 TaxID=2908889 RepID=UPI001F39D258|nr:hypothetical protein [Pseudoalteromonas sp. DL2-H2.2]MCF2909477.1 hypothetical protein [Pseudoalteromonas sp. DL2-H2.2]
MKTHSLLVVAAMVSTSVMAGEKSTTTDSDWMPVGMVNTNASDKWGPNLVDVRIAQFTNQSNQQDFKLTYEEQVKTYLSGQANDHFLYTETADWNNPDWARSHVLATAEAFTKKTYELNGVTENYKWCNRHTPYLVKNSSEVSGYCGIGDRGIDCSNFTTFIYNYALGNRFSSHVQKQAGQDPSSLIDGRYSYPNESSFDVNAVPTSRAGNLVCKDGSLAQPSCSGSAPYISAFDDKGVLDSGFFAQFETDYINQLKPGDLLYFDWKSSSKVRGQVVHAAIWTGKESNSTPKEWYVIQNGELVSKGASSFDYLWGVRRVIKDTDTATGYVNKSYGVDKFVANSSYGYVSIDCTGGPSYAGTNSFTISFLDAANNEIGQAVIDDMQDSSCSVSGENSVTYPVLANINSHDVKTVKLTASDGNSFWIDRIKLTLFNGEAGQTKNIEWGLDNDQGWALSTDANDGQVWSANVPLNTAYSCISYHVEPVNGSLYSYNCQ